MCALCLNCLRHTQTNGKILRTQHTYNLLRLTHSHQPAWARSTLSMLLSSSLSGILLNLRLCGEVFYVLQGSNKLCRHKHMISATLQAVMIKHQNNAHNIEQRKSAFCVFLVCRVMLKNSRLFFLFIFFPYAYVNMHVHMA